MTPTQHGDQRRRAAVRVPARRLLAHRQRHVVAASVVAAMGRTATRSTQTPASYAEVPGRGDQGVLSRGVQQGRRQRRVVRRRSSRPIQPVPVRAVRRHEDPRRAVGRRALRRTRRWTRGQYSFNSSTSTAWTCSSIAPGAASAARRARRGRRAVGAADRRGRGVQRPHPRPRRRSCAARSGTASCPRVTTGSARRRCR